MRIIRDSPGLFWILGALFVGVGALFALGALALFSDAGTMGVASRSLAFAMGSVGVATGVWFLRRSPASSVIVDAANRVVIVRRVGLRGRQETLVPFDDVRSAEIEQGVDDEGNAVYRPTITTKYGAVVLLSELHVHDKARVEQVLEDVRRQMSDVGQPN